MRLLKRRAVRIALDVGLLVGFLAEFITREGPDYAVHSWIGIVLIPVITLHLLGNLPWVRRVIRRGRDDPEFSLGLLNAVLGALTAVCIVSGFPLWLEWSDSGALSGVHTITGFLSIILMFAHLWRNRSRVTMLLRRRTVAAV